MASKLVDPLAITMPLVAEDPAYEGPDFYGVSNLQWCEAECARLASKDDQARVERRGRLCWVTRAKERTAKDNGRDGTK